MTKKSNSKMYVNWAGITWLFLIILSVAFLTVSAGFIAFPIKYLIYIGIILFLVDTFLGVFSLNQTGRSTSTRHIKKIIVTFINLILSFCLLTGSIYLPILQEKMKGIFVDPADTQEVRINAYVMTSKYKSMHPELFADTNTSMNLLDYIEKKFIIQTKVDQENQAYALEDIQSQLNTSTINSISEQDVISSVAALYQNVGDVLILNSSYESALSDIAGYENFSSETEVLYSVTKTIKVKSKEKSVLDYTNHSFSVFIAGSDSRSTELSYYTRTDTNLLLTVDPVNKQILLISIPRDWYVKNPALGNGFDKLTHLGNNGIQNTIDGLNEEFSFDYIENYFEVNFVTFYNIVEAVGGIDINNPYAFSVNNGAAYDTAYGVKAGYVFEEGNLHLNGNQALSYVRERYNLTNGDYGRNEHQAIVLQAIISKLTSKEILTSFNSLLNSLQGNFLTSMNTDDIYALAKMQLNDGGSWKFVNYHLEGIGDNNVTASMGNQELYVSYPIAEQVEYVKQQINSVMNGEIIAQGSLPVETKTPYLPN